MATQKTVGSLRESASRLLPLLDLTSVHLATSNYESVDRESGDVSLVSAFAVQTKFERSSDVLQTWAKYEAWALAISPGEDVPENLDDLEPQFIEEHYVWRFRGEWVAEFIKSDDIDLEGLAASDCQAFALVMAPPTVHPYARELIQSLTERGRYPALSLGLLTPITQLPDDELIDMEEVN